MRFLWLAFAIVVPLLFGEILERGSFFSIGVEPSVKEIIYWIVFVIFETLSVSFTISEFIKQRKIEIYDRELQIKRDRDEDIAKWRKEFADDTIRLYEIQKEALKRAREINDSNSNK